MTDFDREIREALERGYPTVAQRKRWGSDQWAKFEAGMSSLKQAERQDYEDGNSPERLRELIEQLQERVLALEERSGS